MKTRSASLAVALFERFNSRDPQGLAALLSPDVKHLAPGSQFGVDLEGRRALVQYFQDNVFPKFQKIEFNASNIFQVPDANVEIAEWQGSFVTKNGVEFTSRGVFVLEHDGRQICWMREYFDTEKTKNAFASSSEQVT